MAKITIAIYIILINSFFTKYSYCEKDSHSGKTVGFIIHTQNIGGKAVHEIYQEMKNFNLNVKIIAIPSFYYGKLLAPIDLKFVSKFNPKDVTYPCGKFPPYKKCKSISNLKLDYLFIQNPYDSFARSPLDPNFMIKKLRKISHYIGYIVYGPHLFHQDSINDPYLKDYINKVFVDSDSTKNIYREKYKFSEKNIINCGYHSYKMMRDKIKVTKKNNNIETILWLPRWTLSFQDRDLYEGGSTFLSYYQFFFNYMQKNPKMNLVIRPHQLLFDYAINNQFLSREDVEVIVKKFLHLKNVKISQHSTESLIDDIAAADVVISDGTSALAEVIVADKPIIYLSNGLNLEFNSNELSKALKDYVYLAYKPEDIISNLELLRKKNYSVINSHISQAERDKFKKNLDPVENPARCIAKYILQN